MSSPQKDSDGTEHAMDEAKSPEIEIKSSGTDKTAKSGELASPLAVLKEVSDVAVVKAEQVKSLEEIAPETVSQSPTRKTISSQSNVPTPAVDSNIDSSKAIAIQEVTVTMVPSIKITYISPDKIKEEPVQTTGKSEISEEVERKIEKQNVDKLPQKPGCEEPEKANVPEKVQLKSSLDTAVKEVKLSSEMKKTQKESELPKFDTNIDLSKTESVPEKTAPNVPVPDSSTVKTKDESKEKIKSSDASEQDDRISVTRKGQKSEIQATEEVENQMSGVPRCETILKTNLDELKSSIAMPEKSSIGIVEDSVTTLLSKIKATESARVKETKPSVDSPPPNIDLKGLSSDEETTLMSKLKATESARVKETKPSVDCPPPNIDLKGLSSDVETTLMSKLKATKSARVKETKPSVDSPPPNIDLEGLSSDEETTNFSTLADKFKFYLSGDRKEPRIKIAKPDFPCVSTRLQPIVRIIQGKFQVSLDVSQFDIKNIDLSVKDGKIEVFARQGNETDFGMEYHEIQQIFKIPNHVNRDKFSACITKDYRLLVEAPIRTLSDDSSK